DLTAFASELLATQELISRARSIARALTEALPGCSTNIYTAGVSLAGAADRAEVWIPRAWSGEQTVRGPIGTAVGTLAQLAAQRQPLLHAGSDLSREDYAHLDIRRTLRSLAYLPLESASELIGAVEVLSFEVALSAEELHELEDFAQIAATALATAHRYESERNDSLASISRLTQLYDLEKSFSSTLEMDELGPIIGEKLRE